MTKVVTTDNSGNIACAAEICDLISGCSSIPHNKSLKIVGTELQLTDTLNNVVECDVADLINVPASESVTNVRLYTDGKLLKLEDSAGDTVSNNMVSNAQACLPDLTYSFLPDTSVPTGALMLLDATGKPAKRADLADLVDGSTVTYNATTGKLSAAGGSTPPTPTYIKQADIPASIDDNTKALVPAAVLAMLKYLRPTSSTGGLTAKQLSADAIDCQVFSNVTCDGSGNVTSFKIPKPGSSTDMCTVTIPTGGSGGSTAGTVVWEGMSNGCISLAGKGAGLYMAVCISTFDQQGGLDERFVLPFIFFDIPDPIDGKNVGMTYKRDGWSNLVNRPSECITVSERFKTALTQPFNNGENPGSLQPVPLGSMVWQTFKSGLLVRDTERGHDAHVVKVVKLT